MNLNLQRELDALHEKYNKLDAKMRKERASRKATKASSPPQQPETPPTSKVPDGLKRPAGSADDPARGPVGFANDEPHHVSDGEYEYEYVDEPSPSSPPPPAPVALAKPTGPLAGSSPWTPYIRRRHIDIRDF